MATLAVDTARDYETGQINEMPVIAADIIYEGAAVGDNGSGYARPLEAADPFMGFAEQRADNSGGAAGDVNVRFKREGVVKLAVTGGVITSVGSAVYASDDGTFTMTSTSNSYIGEAIRFVSTAVLMVEFSTKKSV